MPYIRRLPSKKWQATVYLPDGRRVTTSNVSKTIVRRWATDREARIARGEIIDPANARMSVKAWMAAWTAARVVELSTARGDVSARRRIIETFGRRPVSALSRLEVQSWVRQLQADGVGAQMIRRTYNHLAAAMNAAVAEGVIIKTPCRRISLPPTPPQQPRWYTEGEVAAVVSKLREPHATMVLLMCYDALRWGEAAGLRVRDVDPARCKIRVVGAMTQDGRRKEHGKTSKSRRELPVPGWIMARLVALVQARVTDPDSLVFVTWRQARPMSGPNWRRVWYAAVAEAGVRWETPHVCRHTGISWQVQAGVDLYRVQAFAGHESYATTQRYAHLAPDAFDAIEAAWPDNQPLAIGVNETETVVEQIDDEPGPEGERP